jgi:hypothetical protein
MFAPLSDVHLHVWGDADPEVTRYLRFPDRLRGSPEDRQPYEQLKPARTSIEPVFGSRSVSVIASA